MVLKSSGCSEQRKEAEATRNFRYDCENFAGIANSEIFAIIAKLRIFARLAKFR